MINFKTALKQVLSREGFYSNAAEDAGGETVWGIARNRHPDWNGWEMVDEWKLQPDFPNNMRESATLKGMVEKFYWREFWGPLKCEQMPNQELAEELFEQAVNIGLVTAIMNLQRALNVLNDQDQALTMDGVLGPVTLAAVFHCANQGDNAELLKTLNCLQRYRYIEIVEHNPKKKKWFRGWLERA